MLKRPRESDGWSAARRWVLVPVLVGLMLGVAACGSDDSDDSGGSEEAGDEPAAEQSDAGEGVTDYVAYVGGSDGPADDSLPPVKVGWVNNEGGSIPPIGADATNAAEWSVQYINENLGGVDGHPMELDTCLVKNAEEEGLQCGQRFLNDDAVKAVAYGGVSVGASTINSTIDGDKPIFMAVSVNPSDETNPNTYVFGGTTEFTVYGYGAYAADIAGAESVAVVYPEAPGLTEVAEAINRATEATGIDTEFVGFNPDRGDVLGALTAAGAGSADLTILVAAGSDCVAAADGLEQLGVSEDKVLSLPQCAVPDLRDAHGGDYPQWTYGTGWSAQGNDPPTPAGAHFRDVLDEYGFLDKVTDPWWPATLAQFLTITKFLNAVAAEEGGIEQITTPAIVEQAEAFEGPLPLGGPNIACGKYPHAPASCNDEVIFFDYTGDDNWALAADWQVAPQELQAELDAQK